MNNKPFALISVASLFLAGAVAVLNPPAAQAQSTPPPPPPSLEAADLPVLVAPTNPNVRYLGRWDTRDPAGPRAAWPACAVEFRYIGSAVNVVMSDAGNGGDAFEVVVDGHPVPGVLTLSKGRGIYSLGDASRSQPGVVATHTVELVKRTEAFVGTTQVLGFQVSNNGEMLPWQAPAPKHKLEIIGDSITCGYGNEAASAQEHFTPATEDAYLSYGALAARDLNADYHCIAWSGRKMSPDNAMPSIYGLTLPTDPSSAWDFSSWTPDAVVINLGTNDFARGNPDRAQWTAAYEQFLNTVVRAHYPKAFIYVAIGPMTTDAYPPGQNALTTIKSYLRQIVGDERQRGNTRIRVLFFAPQDPANGLGADSHPSVKTDAIMAGTLETALRADLRW